MDALIDARHMFGPHFVHGGIGRYVWNLVTQFARDSDGLQVGALVRRADLPRVTSLPGALEVRPLDVPIYTLREQILLPLRASGAGVLHEPHYNIPLAYRGKLIVTVHDVTHLLFPQFTPGRIKQAYARLMLPAAVRRASRIITVSEFTKQHLKDLFGIEAERISVIHLGIDRSFAGSDSGAAPAGLGIQRHRLPEASVLYVGNIKEHKNLPILLDAFALASRENRLPHHLLIAGEGDVTALRKKAAELGIGEKVRFLQDLDDRELQALYASASVFVLPSLSEGFGLTALEAMACGVPVLASRAGSLPEILGEAALFFEPASAEQLASLLCRVCSDSKLAESMRGLGKQHARLFSWQRCAEEHLKVYREVLQK